MEKLRQTLKVKKERAILVAAVLHSLDGANGLSELTALAESAGAVVVDKFQQKIRKINPSTYIGKGKEIAIVGANFSSEKRNISDWEEELLAEDGVFIKSLNSK